MKNHLLPLFLLVLISFTTSCSNDGPIIEPEEKAQEPEIIELPDELFWRALYLRTSIDTDNNGTADISMIDRNRDGKIQRSDAELVTSMILTFDNPEIGRMVDLSGIENFVNLQYLIIRGNLTFMVEDNEAYNELITYDFTGLKKLKSLRIHTFATNFVKTVDLSGLSNLTELKLTGNRPYYDILTEDNIKLPGNFMHVNMEGLSSLETLNISNSFLNIDFCKVPSLKVLHMAHLQGGEPEFFISIV